MKVQIICEKCGSIVELILETVGKLCYANSKLENASMYCDVDIESEISTELEDIKNVSDVEDIEIDTT